MFRRAAVALLVLATLVLVGFGLYSHFFSPPDVVYVEVPRYQPPTDQPPAAPDAFAKLAETDPVGMLAACLGKYEQDAKGFAAILAKRERVLGKLGEPEIVHLRVWGDVPGPDKATQIKVRMTWEKGERKDFFGNLIRSSLYVQGANNNQMLTYRPGAQFLQEFPVDPKVKMARESSRYCVTDAGIYRGMLRTYTAWKKQAEAGELKTEYLGKRTVPEAGARECYVVKRTCRTHEVDSFALDELPPTDPKTIARDGFSEVTLLIDVERRLQVGTIIRRADGELVGEYYFRDLVLVKDEFPPDTFTAAALRN